MPVTTLHPENQPRPNTIVAEPQMDQYTALRRVGWIQPIDYLLMVLLILCWLTILAWHVFGNPTPWNILSCCLVAAIIAQAWLVILVYRCMHFVLLIQAYLNTLPDEAARIVMAAYAGRTVKPPS